MIQTVYQKAIVFAAAAHKEQKVPGTDYSYIVHLSNVCMEILSAHIYEPINDIETAVAVALLHDTIEDTDVKFEDIEYVFGLKVAEGVEALSKDKSIEKEKRITDSLERIAGKSKIIGMVKMADRITNLQPPPAHWSMEKVGKYKAEAEVIYEKLKHCHNYLAERLYSKIQEYGI